MAILLPSRSREKLVVILALVIVFTAVTSVLRPFEGSVENISDMCSRIALIITLAVGLAGQDVVVVGGEGDRRQNCVGSGVSGNGGSSSVSHSQSEELVGGRFGGLVSIFSHVHMQRFLA